MARRRKRKQNEMITLMFLGVGALVILTIIAINNPWSIVSIIFTLILICVAFVGIYSFWGSIGVKAERVKRLKLFAPVRSTPEMGFFTPTEFESYVGTIYESLGYNVTVTKQSGDGGIDLILKKKDEVVAVQVKRYMKGGVGRPEIQRLVGASLHNFNKMIFVTTSYYSNEAREYAVQHGVELIDGDTLSAMAQKVFGPDYIHKALSSKLLREK